MKKKKKIYLGDKKELLNDNDVLDQHNLIINLKYQFMSCSENGCGSILSSENWKAHLTNIHQTLVNISAPVRIEIENLCEHTNPENRTLIQLPEDGSRVQGLIIDKGYQCTYCSFISVSQKAIQSHVSINCNKSNFDEVTFQRFNNLKFKVNTIFFFFFFFLKK